ncbi:MAG: efflux RND transporter periplasmic adaptor subunit, partial [Candidatus Promineifilaceae bacterium]
RYLDVVADDLDDALARAEAARARLDEGTPAAQLAILEAQVAAAETNLALAQLRLDQARLVAPMAGRVAAVLIKPGEQAAPGAPALTIVDQAAFHIEILVDEIDIDRVTPGQPVEISLDALPDAPLQGQIAAVAPTPTTSATGVVAYLVTVNLEPGDVELRPGMTANASIVVDEVDEVLVAPNWAIRLDRESGQAFVNRLGPAGLVEETPVSIGLRNEQFSQITAGLAEGDTVAITNQREAFSFLGG